MKECSMQAWRPHKYRSGPSDNGYTADGWTPHTVCLDEKQQPIGTHIDGEWIRDRIFGLVEALDDFLECLVLNYQLVRRLWPDTSNRSAVVTSTQDANVNELLL